MHIELLPAFETNYHFLFHGSGEVAVVDPGDAKVVQRALNERDLKLTHILCTHHHPDHIGGNLALKETYDCQIIGHKHDAARIPGIDVQVEEGDSVQVAGLEFEVTRLDGHTIGHIAYHCPDKQIAFVGDVIFAMGCGRLFEGTPEQMHESLQKIAAWPDDTKLYCAHEYTRGNAEFALTIEPANMALKERYEKVKERRAIGMPTIPTTLAQEKATNPFLRAKSVDEFATRREAKDNF